MIEDYQAEFLQFALDHGVLKFGEFQLKSGRTSPYFFNAGNFNTGKALSQLGKFYARALVASGMDYDLLFGPAYKGIPLAAATGIALAAEHNVDVPYVFNRKESKTHGEGGLLVGAELKGRTVIVDDVITAGTAIREVMDIIAEPEIGKIYNGKVVKIVEFGAFVNFLGAKDGLLHVSQISQERVANVADVLSEGQEVQVKVLDVDRSGKVKLSMKEV